MPVISAPVSISACTVCPSPPARLPAVATSLRIDRRPAGLGLAAYYVGVREHRQHFPVAPGLVLAPAEVHREEVGRRAAEADAPSEENGRTQLVATR